MKVGKIQQQGKRLLSCVRLHPTLISILLLAVLCALNERASAAGAADDPVLQALKEEMERSKAKLKMENVGTPYYIEYRVTEMAAFDASATFGALESQQRGGGRFLRVVVRLGDYKQDSYYGAGEGVTDIIPLDDDIYAIRHRLWLATDHAYKEAGEAFSAKQSALKELKVDEPVDDFARAQPVEVIEPVVHLPDFDFAQWVQLIEEASGLYRSDPKIEHFTSSLHFAAVNRYFVNSEGTVARSGHAIYAIEVSGSTQAADGMRLQRSHEDEARDLNGLPLREQFLKTSSKMLETLKQLREAPLVDEEYRGPVLFSNDGGSSVVSELIAPNLLGQKPPLGANARTTGLWSSSYRTRVLPDFINIFDDPTINLLAGQPLFGDYAVDDEGVRARRVPLIERGRLVSYLMGREPIRDFPESNGHGRAPATNSPSPQPGNLILQSTNPQPDDSLKKKLMELARQRDLPYAYYAETLGPKLEPRLLYRIYTNDGHEELVRGAVFGDLDVRSLRTDLIATGNEPAIENRFESVPYSVASPALLFDELQIKRTQASKQELPEYPPPAQSGSHHP